MRLQTQLERIAAKGQLVTLTFMQSGVAANQTDADLPIVETGAEDGGTAVTAHTIPYPFDILAMSCSLSAAASAGTLTINPTVGGTADTTLQIDVTTGTEGYDKVGVVRGKAGDSVGVQINTDNSWDGTTADLAVTLYVMVYLDNI